MWRENYFCCARASTTEYNKVAWGKQKKCCIVQHLFSEKFDRDQTSYNKIQQDKTRYNKVAKRVQHFIKHQSCMMLYEMLYSFGRGLTRQSLILKFVFMSPLDSASTYFSVSAACVAEAWPAACHSSKAALPCLFSSLHL